MPADSFLPTPTSTWPRKRCDGRPIVGYRCTTGQYEIELVDTGERIAHDCPNCTTLSPLTAIYEREPSVHAAVEQCREQLAAHHGITLSAMEPPCRTCGTTTEVTLDPGTTVDDLQWRCEEHHL